MTLKHTFFLLLCLFLGLSTTILEETPPNPKGIIDLANLFNYANQEIPEKAILNHNTGNPMTDLGATLGRVLFYDKKLSLNGTTACASCHQQENAFGDTSKVSIGFDGRATERHAMRLINVDFSPDHLRFWDKRGISLEGTVTLPYQNEIEMGFSGSNGQPNMDSLISKMQTIPYYPSLFNAVFGDEQITENRMQLALAQFIRSIMSYDAKFDEGFEEIGNEITAFPNFTDQENEGKRLFFSFPPFDDGPQTDRTGAFCGVCHKVPSFSILHFAQSNGVIGVAGDSTAVDISVIRSPSIRDLVKPDGTSNGPFMHDGSLVDLAAVIDHYNDIPANPVNTNLSGLLFPNGSNEVKLNLTDDHKAALVAFLKTLSGNEVYTNEKWSNPFDENENLQVIFDNNCTTIQSTLAVTICANEQYEGLSQSGVYTNTFTTASGCDSIQILTLEVLPLVNSTVEQTICAGEAFLGYTESGIYTNTFTNALGCDSIHTLTLEVLPLVNSTVEQTICAGESFLGYTESGVYANTFTNALGCDSIQTLTLEVLPLVNSAVEQTICAGEAFLGYTESGVYANTFTNALGCDSIQTLTLEVLPLVNSAIEQTICAGESFLGYTESGVYANIFTNALGCDSIHTLTLEVLPLINSAIEQTICAGESVLGYTESGVYANTFTNTLGCDSIHTLTLEVLPLINSAIEQTICAGESFLGYTESGVYADTLDNLSSCDTLRTLMLTVLEASADDCLKTSITTIKTSPEIVVFPNPFTNSINFNNLPNDHYQWTLTNTMGQLIQRGQLSNVDKQSINILNSPPGLYLLELAPRNTKNTFVFKLLRI